MLLSGCSLSARHSSKCCSTSSRLSLKLCQAGHVIVPVHRREAEALGVNSLHSYRGWSTGVLPPVYSPTFYKIVMPSSVFPTSCPAHSRFSANACRISSSTIGFAMFCYFLWAGNFLLLSVLSRIIAKKNPSNVFSMLSYLDPLCYPIIL